MSRLLLLLGVAAAFLCTDTALAGHTPRVAYLLHCGGCHLPDGSSNPPEVPDLRGELGRIIAVPGGRDYLARVPGASQAPVSDEDLARILNWVLHQFNAKTLPDDFTPLTADEVGRSRRNVLTDPLKHRAALWERYETANE
ncbi:MAG: cytochrome c [Gammaproteobacteria bacterium]|nr:cytochrome c [Gammaproteobacteria bacterium]